MARGILVTILIGCTILSTNAQSKPQSLCNLPQLAPGTHRSVRVAAVAKFGAYGGVLTDASCPAVKPTWFELSLESERNRNTLQNEIEKFGKAAVVLSGELYGPPLPYPKLPKLLSSNDNQGWGHLGVFPRKIVALRIDLVAPAGNPKSKGFMSKSAGETDRAGIPLGFTTFVAQDGAGVTVFYLVRDSQQLASSAFQRELSSAIRIVKRRKKRNKDGEIVGDWAQIRIRGIDPQRAPLDAIMWTDRSSFHEMISASLKDLLELEKVY
jgi:hypothetical protein